MNQPAVVLDADVLVPVLVCDLLLSMFDAELFQPTISPTILEEVERSLIADFPHLDPSGLRRRVDAMARALALHVYDVTKAHDDALAGINRKDRHVAALALSQHAELVVSNDRRLRREINSLSLPLRALRPTSSSCSSCSTIERRLTMSSTSWSPSDSADRSPAQHCSTNSPSPYLVPSLNCGLQADVLSWHPRLGLRRLQ